MGPSEHVICDPRGTYSIRRPTSGASRSPDRDDPCGPRATALAGQAIRKEAVGGNQHEITAERVRGLVHGAGAVALHRGECADRP